PELIDGEVPDGKTMSDKRPGDRPDIRRDVRRDAKARGFVYVPVKDDGRCIPACVSGHADQGKESLCPHKFPALDRINIPVIKIESDERDRFCAKRIGSK